MEKPNVGPESLATTTLLQEPPIRENDQGFQRVGSSSPSKGHNLNSSPDDVHNIQSPLTQNASKIEGLTIRPIQLSDVQSASRILNDAFWNESAVGQYTHPRREQYPDDVRRYWRRKILTGMCDYKHDTFVAVIRDKNTGKEKIVGLVDLADFKPGSRENGMKYHFRLPLTILSNFINHIHRPNRAAPYPERLTVFVRMFPKFILPLLTATPARAESLSLYLVGVDPKQQNLGIGRAMVAKALQRANDEKRGISVVCAEGKLQFYQRCGFGEVVGKVTDGKGNEMGERGVNGGEVCFWWPEGVSDE